MNFLDQFRSARRSSVPLVIIRTADYTSVEKEITRYYGGLDNRPPILHWDISRGIEPINEAGQEAAAIINKPSVKGQTPAMVTGNPVEALQRVLDSAPEKTILFMENLQIALEDIDVRRISLIQAIWNCRDPFKANKRTLVMLVPDIRVPAELVNDVIIIDVPLPDEATLRKITLDTAKAANLQIDKETASRAVSAVSGLSEFLAENALAMSMPDSGLDLESLWEIKRTAIRQLGGLSVERRRVRFEDLGGLWQLKQFLQMIIKGKYCPRLVVLIDEIDRQLSGINDSTGVGGDAYQQILSAMQDYGWDGMLLPGFAGTGKTEIGHAFGTEAGGLFLKFDMGGMQDKYVGNSQKMIRAAIKMLVAMGGERVFFIGTTNRAEALRPELKRRFSYGTFFFDLLSMKEQEPIWNIYLKKYGVTDTVLPDCRGWTGAEIKACCKRADELSIPLRAASAFVAPVSKTMGDAAVRELRESAHGKYLSATTEGFYDMNSKEFEAGLENIRAIGKEE